MSIMPTLLLVRTAASFNFAQASDGPSVDRTVQNVASVQCRDSLPPSYFLYQPSQRLRANWWRDILRVRERQQKQPESTPEIQTTLLESH